MASEPPYGLGYAPDVIASIQQETRQMLLGQKVAEVQALQKHGVNQYPGRPTVSPLMIPLVHCYINSFQRASSVEKPWPGGEKRIDVRVLASRGIVRRWGR